MLEEHGLADIREMIEWGKVSRDIDDVIATLGEKPLSLFKASEFMRFSHIATRNLLIFGNKEQLERKLNAIRDILSEVEAREVLAREKAK